MIFCMFDWSGKNGDKSGKSQGILISCVSGNAVWVLRWAMHFNEVIWLIDGLFTISTFVGHIMLKAVLYLKNKMSKCRFLQTKSLPSKKMKLLKLTMKVFFFLTLKKFGFIRPKSPPQMMENLISNKENSWCISVAPWCLLCHSLEQSCSFCGIVCWCDCDVFLCLAVCRFAGGHLHLWDCRWYRRLRHEKWGQMDTNHNLVTIC